MRVLSLESEVNTATFEREIYARLLFSINDLPSEGEYGYRCRKIGEKILEALDLFERKKKNG